MGGFSWFKKLFGGGNKEDQVNNSKKTCGGGKMEYKEVVATTKGRKYEPYESNREKRFRKSAYYVKEVVRDYEEYHGVKNRTEPLTSSELADRIQKRTNKIRLLLADMEVDLRRRSKSF